MLNKSLGKVNVYVGTDGKLHFVNASGADSVLNFSSGSKKLTLVKTGKHSMSGVTYTWDSSKPPSVIYILAFYAGNISWSPDSPDEFSYSGAGFENKYPIGTNTAVKVTKTTSNSITFACTDVDFEKYDYCIYIL